MPLTQVWQEVFDSEVKVAKWFCCPEPLNGELAHLKLVTVDGVQCMELWVGDEIPAVTFVSDATATAEAKMAANLNFPAGAVAHVYSTTAAQHGRRVKSGTSGTGSWDSNLGPIKAPLWLDSNHEDVVQVMLAFCSWFDAGDPGAPSDGAGAYIDKTGLPNIPDLRGHVLRWHMRLQQGEFDRATDIRQHVQTHIPSMPNAPNGARKFVNCQNIATSILDELGRGTGGPFSKGANTYVDDTGWNAEIDIPLEALASHWLAMGGKAGKQGEAVSGDDYAYVSAHPRRWLSSVTGNAYMMLTRDNAGGVTPPPSFKGRLLVRSVTLLQQT